jgi:hypothetical protein
VSKAEERQFQQVAEAITALLAEAVKETLEQGSPEPARECVAELVDIDRHAAPEEEGGPAELMATLALVRWAGLARLEVGEGRPGWVEDVLGWVEETLGKRYRARARYTSGALRSEEEAGEIMIYAGALRDDFLPSLVWLMAGAVALHGGGDIAWLRDLERNAALTGR